MLSGVEGQSGTGGSAPARRDSVAPDATLLAAPARGGSVGLLDLHPLIAIALVFSLYLQRFGIHTASGSFVSAGHVVVLGAALGLVVLRRASIDLANTMLLAAFTAFALALTAGVVSGPLAITEVSPQSLFLIVTLYAVLCVAPVPLGNTRDVLYVYNTHMMLMGVLGILQFLAQFAGVRFFTFRGIVPDSFLIEFAYNVVIPTSYLSPVFKSNGVFFLEPSLFSQFTALALAAEVLLFRRPAFILVYCLAIVASYSGSGLLTLATALVVLSVIRPRYTLFLFALAVAAALMLAVLSKVAPQVYDYYTTRALEFRTSGSSGYQRYVTPYMLLGAVAQGWGLVVGYGPGSAEKFRLLGFDYDINAMVKIVVEYGLIGAGLFFGFLFTAIGKRGSGSFLIVLCMSWYFLGGGYQLTSCVVHTIAALLVWSSWDAASVAAGAVQPADPARGDERGPDERAPDDIGPGEETS